VHSSKLPADIQRRAHNKLLTLYACTALDTLRIPPSNHLEALKGNRTGQHSIRINKQWRICFRWQNGNTHDVDGAQRRWRSKSQITTKIHSTMTLNKLYEIAPPGRILREEFLEDSGITQTALAKALGLTQPRLNELLQGRRRLTADDALRLSRFFGTDAQFWMNLQSAYDLLTAERVIGKQIEREVMPMAS